MVGTRGSSSYSSNPSIKFELCPSQFSSELQRRMMVKNIMKNLLTYNIWWTFILNLSKLFTQHGAEIIVENNLDNTRCCRSKRKGISISVFVTVQQVHRAKKWYIKLRWGSLLRYDNWLKWRKASAFHLWNRALSHVESTVTKPVLSTESGRGIFGTRFSSTVNVDMWVFSGFLPQGMLTGWVRGLWVYSGFFPQGILKGCVKIHRSRFTIPPSLASVVKYTCFFYIFIY